MELSSIIPKEPDIVAFKTRAHLYFKNNPFLILRGQSYTQVRVLFFLLQSFFFLISHTREDIIYQYTYIDTLTGFQVAFPT